MEVKLTDAQKADYDNMLKSIQDLEATIGSTQYRMHKLVLMREDVDKGIKLWWEEALKELGLDPKLDYMITKDGSIQDVPRNKPVEATKPITVSDLK
jgi:hypothetical protein